MGYARVGGRENPTPRRRHALLFRRFMSSKFPTDKTDKAIDAGGAIAAAVPWIGGPVPAVLSGIGQQRKLNRIQEVLDKLAEEIKDLDSDISKNYVRTEDFEELLEQTPRRAADERHEEVRELYVQFLRQAIAQPGDEYDEQLAVLRLIAAAETRLAEEFSAPLQLSGISAFETATWRYSMCGDATMKNEDGSNETVPFYAEFDALGAATGKPAYLPRVVLTLPRWMRGTDSGRKAFYSTYPICKPA
jgi:hypothetical protein